MIIVTDSRKTSHELLIKKAKQKIDDFRSVFFYDDVIYFTKRSYNEHQEYILEQIRQCRLNRITCIYVVENGLCKLFPHKAIPKEIYENCIIVWSDEIVH